jgi:hypothetical protein
MDASTIWASAPTWISTTRNWLSERARRRRDAEEISRMDSREKRDLGFSHTAAVESGIMLTEIGPVEHRSWVHAQPCFPRRAPGHY